MYTLLITLIISAPIAIYLNITILMATYGSLAYAEAMAITFGTFIGISIIYLTKKIIK